MMRLRFILTIGIAPLLPVSAEGDCQDNGTGVTPVSLGIRGHYGFIIPHSRAIAEISASNPWAVEADLAWHLTRERIWKYCYCYPRTGFSFNYIHFGLPEILGQSVAVYPYIEPFIRAQKRISFSFRFGIGPAWLTKVYDADANPENFFFSSHLSFIAMLNAALNARISQRITVRAAFNYNHISNGGISLPNVGMNFPGMNVGLDYSFRDVRFPRRATDTMRVLYAEKTWWDGYLLGIMKDAEKGEKKSYPVFGAGIYYNILILRLLALNAGTEWISDFSEKERIRRAYVQDPGLAPDHNRAALLTGFSLLFGQVSFIHQWGLYYYDPYPARHRVYQRYGLNLRVTERFFLGINIKAHGHVADLMDIRLGTRFGINH